MNLFVFWEPGEMMWIWDLVEINFNEARYTQEKKSVVRNGVDFLVSQVFTLYDDGLLLWLHLSRGLIGMEQLNVGFDEARKNVDEIRAVWFSVGEVGFQIVCDLVLNFIFILAWKKRLLERIVFFRRQLNFFYSQCNELNAQKSKRQVKKIKSENFFVFWEMGLDEC